MKSEIKRCCPLNDWSKRLKFGRTWLDNFEVFRFCCLSRKWLIIWKSYLVMTDRGLQIHTYINDILWGLGVECWYLLQIVDSWTGFTLIVIHNQILVQVLSVQVGWSLWRIWVTWIFLRWFLYRKIIPIISQLEILLLEFETFESVLV